jgi:hypothetical protein
LTGLEIRLDMAMTPEGAKALVQSELTKAFGEVKDYRLIEVCQDTSTKHCRFLRDFDSIMA